MCSGRRLNCRRSRYPIRASGGIRRPGSTFAAASAAHKHSPLVRPRARSDMAFPGDAAPLAGTAAGFPSAWCALLAAPGAPSSPQGGNCGVFPICLVHFSQLDRGCLPGWENIHPGGDRPPLGKTARARPWAASRRPLQRALVLPGQQITTLFGCHPKSANRKTCWYWFNMLLVY